MKKFTIVFAVVISALWSKNTTAQDFHFSQFDAMPLYYNPAQTGMFADQDLPYRFSGIYRSQWQKLNGKPYSAVGAGYDMNFNRFGGGIVILNHISGASNFDVFQTMLSGAYQITDESSKNHFLTMGAQLGIYQKKFSQRDLLFENQYNGVTGFDPNLPNGETLPDLSILKFDANMGVWYKYVDPNSKFDVQAGVGLFHLTQPNESFTGEKSKLPMRFNSTIMANYHIDDRWTVSPNALFMGQAKARDINTGIMASYAFNTTSYAALGGLNVRWKDSVVFHAGMKHKNNIFRISYDMVTSSLKRFSGTRGAFELGFIYCGL